MTESTPLESRKQQLRVAAWAFASAALAFLIVKPFAPDRIALAAASGVFFAVLLPPSSGAMPSEQRPSALLRRMALAAGIWILVALVLSWFGW